ncbi:MAG: winged helix-turn-helix domain-containing protein [Blastocatellia bacterium]|nr:winged helix-turn-helix domain-containing protein [Blastocatellia bacterium]
MSDQNGRYRLEFACECVSVCSGYSDPWAGIAQKKLLPAGTKEEILKIVAQEPRTVAQIAKAMDLSQPSIHTHVREMIESELLRESSEMEKQYPSERYYEPNFPVVKADEVAEFEAICREASELVAGLFEKNSKRLEKAFDKTSLAERGWTFEDLGQFLFARIQRGARHLLEERGVFPSRQKHKNGVDWVFWAEEKNGK